jgi:5-hydroxyisourate hydrolase
MSKSVITTHVLDVAKGVPAKGVKIKLYKKDEASWSLLDEQKTDSDGRVAKWSVSDDLLGDGIYKLNFDVQSYQGEDAFFPEIDLQFKKQDSKHHHVPVLFSPFGYSTYRGS